MLTAHKVSKNKAFAVTVNGEARHEFNLFLNMFKCIVESCKKKKNSSSTPFPLYNRSPVTKSCIFSV